ncbi:hypothetical protein [Alicyclobacillus vulcanalis]|uniref:Uncharacterized protein n=1 Tax=Alicyclobacillus vulcanalis TaxID=252246 RepID=A0A1N7K4J1_9BACL|nr:hypothetical protein [Alicyclobacillus vulcanalis]SIS56513.1 hypothetical protein SAMN05421799_101350 [Alicyclobacillus vulcanalis]
MSLRRAARRVAWAGLVAGGVACAPVISAATSSPAKELQQALQAWQQAPYRQTLSSAQAGLSVTWQAAYAREAAWANLAAKLQRDGQLTLFRAEDDVWQVNGTPAEWFTSQGATGRASVFWFHGAAYEQQPGGWVGAARPPVLWEPAMGAWTSVRLTSQGVQDDEMLAVMDPKSVSSVFGPWIAAVAGTQLFGARGISEADLEALVAHTTVYGHFTISRAAGSPELTAATVAAVVDVPSVVALHAFGAKAAAAIQQMTWRLTWTMRTSYLPVAKPLPQGLHPAGWPSPSQPPASQNSTANGTAGGNAAQSQGSANGSLQNGT